MKNKVKNVIKERVAKDECSHYWIIEGAKGRTSKGVCKFCGAEKEFRNSIQVFTAGKRNTNSLELPEMPDVKFDGEQNSS